MCRPSSVGGSLRRDAMVYRIGKEGAGRRYDRPFANADQAAVENQDGSLPAVHLMLQPIEGT